VPLRAWVRIEGEAADLPLDDFGRRALGVAPGEEVEIRPLPSAVVPLVE
jgi:hypothetical protein